MQQADSVGQSAFANSVVNNPNIKGWAFNPNPTSTTSYLDLTTGTIFISQTVTDATTLMSVVAHEGAHANDAFAYKAAMMDAANSHDWNAAFQATMLEEAAGEAARLIHDAANGTFASTHNTCQIPKANRFGMMHKHSARLLGRAFPFACREWPFLRG